MKAQYLIDILEGEGFEPRPYSGRGMYGKLCVSVNLDEDVNLFDLGVQLAIAVGEDDAYSELHGLNPKTDSMGRGTVLYFPSVRWPDACTTDGDTDDNQE